jgi:hypothetical protein
LIDRRASGQKIAQKKQNGPAEKFAGPFFITLLSLT